MRIDDIRGRALPLRGNDIDTDRIIPARYLRSTSFEGLEAHVFEDDRKTAPSHPFSDPRFAGARVLIVNRNFGCGSSREHAPQALYRWGIRALVGESFSEIFQGNSTMMGLPCFTADPPTVDALLTAVEAHPGVELSLSVDRLTIVVGAELARPVSYRTQLTPATREALLSGAWDPTTLLLENFADVEHVAARLPYLTNFTSTRS